VTNTHLYQYLLDQHKILLERIAGTRYSDPVWCERWQQELRAVSRALWALGEQS